MPQHRALNDLLSKAEAKGWTITRRHMRYRLTHPNASIPIFTGFNPKDHRALANLESSMSRAIGETATTKKPAKARAPRQQTLKGIGDEPMGAGADLAAAPPGAETPTPLAMVAAERAKRAEAEAQLEKVSEALAAERDKVAKLEAELADFQTLRELLARMGARQAALEAPPPAMTGLLPPATQGLQLENKPTPAAAAPARGSTKKVLTPANVGKLLLARRKALGHTQIEAAKIMKFSPASIVNWEKGKQQPREAIMPQLRDYIFGKQPAAE